jgi:hypothetical protein
VLKWRNVVSLKGSFDNKGRSVARQTIALQVEEVRASKSWSVMDLIRALVVRHESEPTSNWSKMVR